MNILTIKEAKDQLNIGDDDDSEDDHIYGLIQSAIGLVEQEVERDIYETQDQVPAADATAIVFAELKSTKQASLQMAVKLALSTLYLYRESETDIKLSENPAFTACLRGFSGVYVG